MSVNFLNLAGQYGKIKSEMDDAITSTIQSGNFILGENVSNFEDQMKKYVGVENAVGVASGTDALLLSLKAFGIGPGDEVIVPSYTFFASAEVVSMVGAKPVFVDVEEDTFCIKVEDIRSKITERTKAIIVVHLFGHPAEMDEISRIKSEFGLKIIEDNAQAIGADYKGKKTGGLSDSGCLSFYPTKNLGAYGDGGMILSDDDDFTDKVRVLRSHGWRKKYEPIQIGLNSRLDEIQAGILMVKLKYLDGWNERRREIAYIYDDFFDSHNIAHMKRKPHVSHAYHLYIISVPNRNYFQMNMKKLNIGTGVYYPLPLHMLKPYENQGHKPADFEISLKASKETIAIPIYPEMSNDDVLEVCNSVIKSI